MLTKREEKREDTCDVIVVGAGLMGAAVAARLTREGFDTAILEARSMAGGATGDSAGMVLTGLTGHYNWAVSAYGRQQAQEVWALTVEGRERLIEATERLDVPLEKAGSLALAVDAGEADALQESVELLREDGFDVQFERGDPLGRGFHAVLRQPDDVTVDAQALTQALLNAEDVVVHEGTEVYHLAPEGNYVRVLARGRMVLAEAVVLAVNGYAPLIHPYFADKIAPVRSLVFVTDPLNGAVLEQPCTANYGGTYCRLLSHHHLLLGAWQHQDASAQEAGLDDGVEDELIHFMSQRFPEVSVGGVQRKSGTMGFTPDGLPLLGTLPDLPQVYFAVGFGGRGLAWTFAVAERLVDAMLHEAELGLLLAGRLEDTDLAIP